MYTYMYIYIYIYIYISPHWPLWGASCLVRAFPAHQCSTRFSRPLARELSPVHPHAHAA